MSWELALIASSVASAGMEVAKSVTEANTGMLIADQKKADALQDAELSKLKAIQDERKRREEFAIWDSEFLASQYYDGASFDAITGDAYEALDLDVSNIRLKGRIQSNNFLATAENYEIEKQNLKTGKWLGVGQAGMTLFEGVHAAETYNPKKTGGLKRAFTW